MQLFSFFIYFFFFFSATKYKNDLRNSAFINWTRTNIYQHILFYTYLNTHSRNTKTNTIKTKFQSQSLSISLSLIHWSRTTNSYPIKTHTHTCTQNLYEQNRKLHTHTLNRNDAVRNGACLEPRVIQKAPEGQGCPRCGGWVYAAEQMLARGRVSIQS